MANLEPRRPRFRILAVIRVTALLALCLALSLAALLRATQARAGDVLVQLGNQLMKLPDAYYGNAVRELWINGLALKVQSGSSRRTPLEVVAEFRKACVTHAAVQLDERQREQASALNQEGWFRSALDGVLVEHGEAGTAVVCIDAMGKAWDVLSVADAARRFVKTGDLLEMGRLRYAWVVEAEQGSVFLTFWTDGSARLLEQFPRDRDAPGADFPDLGRVEGSQRYLSARLSESFLTIYAHKKDSVEELSKQYRASLERGGYRILDKYVHSEGHYSYNFEKGARHGLLSIVSRDGKTLATLLSQP
jgi:hypothetical protein